MRQKATSVQGGFEKTVCFGCSRSVFGIEDQVNEIADKAVSFDGMAEGEVTNDAIVVLASDFLANQESIFFQVSDDTLNGSFGDSNF
jgi:hypothetical protein